MIKSIQKFEIIGLFGYKNISISFKDKVMIVIGENGFGKTSMLNSLTFTLQGEWKMLSNISFDAISITISDLEFSFTKRTLQEYCGYLDHMKDEDSRDILDVVKEKIDEKDFNQLLEYIEDGKKKEFFNMTSNNPYLKSIPGNYLYNAVITRLDREKMFGVFSKITDEVKSLGCEILYLPTYRRVEVGLDSLQLPRRKPLRYRYEEENSHINEFIAVR